MKAGAVLASALLLGATPVAASQSSLPATPAAPEPAPASAAAPSHVDLVAQGRRAYTSFCARCHGINLVVSGGAFYDLRTFPRGDKDRFVRSVRHGVRAMPAWEGIVKPEDIEAIWAYVGSVNGWPATSTTTP